MTLDAFLRHFGGALGSSALVSLRVSFVGGIMASAVCPCTLPVGIGVAGVAGASEAKERKQGLRIAAAFFAGIVINLTLLGAIAARLGALATESFGRFWALAMATLSLVAAAVAFLGPRLKVRQLKALRRPGPVGAIGYGFVFSLGTSVAPLLLLLAVSAANGRPEHGFFLALAFGAFLFNGIGIPAAATGLVYPVWGMVAMALSVTTIFVNSLWGRGGYFFDAIKGVGHPPQMSSKARSEAADRLSTPAPLVS